MTNEKKTETVQSVMLNLDAGLVKLNMIGQTLNALNIGFTDGNSEFQEDSWTMPIDTLCQTIKECTSLFDKAWEFMKG